MTDKRKPGVQVEIDRTADAAYVRLSKKPVARTQQLTDTVLVDLDNLDMVIGIEVLGLDTPIPIDDLTAQFHVGSTVVDTIQSLRPTIAFAWTVNTTNDSVSKRRNMADLVEC